MKKNTLYLLYFYFDICLMIIIGEEGGCSPADSLSWSEKVLSDINIHYITKHLGPGRFTVLVVTTSHNHQFHKVTMIVTIDRYILAMRTTSHSSSHLDHFLKPWTRKRDTKLSLIEYFVRLLFENIFWSLFIWARWKISKFGAIICMWRPFWLANFHSRW